MNEDWSDVPGIAILPNWSTPYRTTSEFKTTVFEAATGDEQRKSMRQAPRRTIEYAGILAGANLRRFTTRMNVKRDNRIFIPEVTRSVRLAEPSPDGRFVIPIVDMPYWCRAGAEIFIYSGRRGEYRTIRSAQEGSIRLTEATTLDFPAPPKIAPALRARFRDTEGLNYETDSVATASFSFSVEPGSDYLVEPFSPALKTVREFRRMENFYHRPNWSGRVNIDFSIPNEVLDYGIGRADRYFRQDFNNQLLKYTFTKATRDSVHAIEDFFYRQKGKRGAFYVPSGVADIEYARFDEARNAILLTDPENLDEDANGDVVNRVLSFRTPAGDQAAGIVEVKMIGARKGIVLDRPLAELGIPLAGTASFLRMARFGTDTVTIDWLTDEVAQMNLTFQSLRDAFGEITIGGKRLTIGGDYVTRIERGLYPGNRLPGMYVMIHGEHVLIGSRYIHV